MVNHFGSLSNSKKKTLRTKKFRYFSYEFFFGKMDFSIMVLDIGDMQNVGDVRRVTVL